MIATPRLVQSTPDDLDRLFVQQIGTQRGVMLTLAEYSLAHYDLSEFVAMVACRPMYSLRTVLDVCDDLLLNVYPYPHPATSPPPLRIELPLVKSRVAFQLRFP